MKKGTKNNGGILLTTTEIHRDRGHKPRRSYRRLYMWWLYMCSSVKCRTKQDKTIVNYRLKTSAWKRNLWQPLFIFFQFVTAMVVLLMVFSMAVIPATPFRIRRNATEPAINGCVKRWSRHPGSNGDVLVAECKKHSFACLHSITKFGFPKCKPVYKIISLPTSSGTEGTRHARVIVNCSCGWVHK